MSLHIHLTTSPLQSPHHLYTMAYLERTHPSLYILSYPFIIVPRSHT
ncbi:hypothetical protein HMPREF9134_00686 [Porphyromonas catoniae F0037]|uniref:Uncharacterized protein n=1 Tax=Porphyromonas catoniae F0037 TaxID=1127696 RepID=L1NG64_9PORP|nr:hypothetical protein HMPREF9134_00686 [Porphyromonas catoniae F0037]